jgi:hypothetical protein
MDEPLGALDKRLRTQMQIEIMRISRNLGSTVVYVTHDQEEALVMSDLIAVYNNGGIEQLGTSRELYETPRTRFVADFIGESVLLPCIAEPDGSCHGVGWHGRLPSRSELRDGRGVLVLRPEDLTLVRDVDPGRGAASDVAHSIAGVVTDVIYVGSALISLVKTGDGVELEVRTPRSEAALSVRQGDRVRVRWQAEHAVVVPDEERTAGSREAGTQLQRRMLEAVDEVLDIVRAESIDAAAIRSGNVVVARNQAAMQRLRDRLASDRSWGYDDEEGMELSSGEVAERIRVHGAVGGLYYPTVGRVDPGGLVRGLAELVERRGAVIHEQSPVTRIESGVARTPRGSVRAGAVLRCTEGYSAEVADDPRRIIPINS